MSFSRYARIPIIAGMTVGTVGEVDEVVVVTEVVDDGHAATTIELL